jgi:hypothetical protein
MLIQQLRTFEPSGVRRKDSEIKGIMRIKKRGAGLSS